MSTNHTQNYQLNQWKPEDMVLRTDFNADNVKIDGAIAAVAEKAAALSESKANQSALEAEIAARKAADTALSSTIAAHAASIAERGNCRIELLTYAGTGQYGEAHSNKVTFSGKPVFFLIFGGSAVLLWAKGCPAISSLYNGGTSYRTAALFTSWSGNTVSWYHNDSKTAQANDALTYYAAAFYAEDEKG